METDRQRWDARYATAEAVVEPSPPFGLDPAWLQDVGNALDIACGRGAQAVWLARRGFVVDAIDISEQALILVSRLAARCGCDERVVTRQVDLDDGLPDWLAARYDVIVCQRFRDPKLYHPLAERLAPGGILVITVLSAAGSASGRGPFHAPPGELKNAFADPTWDVLAEFEDNGEATVVVRRRCEPLTAAG